MIVTLRKTEADKPSRTTAIVADSDEYDSAGKLDHSGRRLRNRIILANVIAWIAIVVAIRLIF